MRRWWQGYRERRAIERRAIPDELWLSTLAHYPFLGQRSAADIEALRRLSSLFLDRKEFSGAGGFVVDDATALSVALQACPKPNTLCPLRMRSHMPVKRSPVLLTTSGDRVGIAPIPSV